MGFFRRGRHCRRDCRRLSSTAAAFPPYTTTSEDLQRLARLGRWNEFLSRLNDDPDGGILRDSFDASSFDDVGHRFEALLRSGPQPRQQRRTGRGRGGILRRIFSSWRGEARIDEEEEEPRGFEHARVGDSSSASSPPSPSSLPQLGQTPLHHLYLCRRYIADPPPLELVETLASRYPRSLRTRTPHDGRTPLHLVTLSRIPPSLAFDEVAFLVRSDPETVTFADWYGWNPFHLAARFGAVDGVLDALWGEGGLHARRALRGVDGGGRTALHVACDYFAGLSLADFRRLVSWDPGSCFEEDGVAAAATLGGETTMDGDGEGSGNLVVRPRRERGRHRRRRRGGCTPLEVLCYEFGGTAERAMRIISSGGVEDGGVSSSSPSSSGGGSNEGSDRAQTWRRYTHAAARMRQLLADAAELREFWFKAQALVRAMRSEMDWEGRVACDVDVGVNGNGNSNGAGIVETFPGMLSACIVLAAEDYCPSLLLRFALCVDPPGVGPRRGEALHLAARAVSVRAAAALHEGGMDDAGSLFGDSKRCKCNDRAEATMHRGMDRCESVSDGGLYEIIDALLERDPESAAVPDQDGLLPLQLVTGCHGGGVGDNDKMASATGKDTHPTAGATWHQGVRPILFFYPPAVESLELDERLYPYLLARFTAGTDATVNNASERGMTACSQGGTSKLSEVFAIVKEKPGLVWKRNKNC